MDLQNLQDHVRTLVTLNETGDPLVSCYRNLESGRATYRNELDLRVRVIRRALPVQARRGFEEALGRIEAFLVSEVLSEANGVALFSRAGVDPFFCALQFKLPLPNHVGVDTVPNIYPLVELKDTYHRYVLLISTEQAVLATLARYAEHEQAESLNTATLLLDELARGALAVQGTAGPSG